LNKHKYAVIRHVSKQRVIDTETYAFAAVIDIEHKAKRTIPQTMQTNHFALDF